MLESIRRLMEDDASLREEDVVSKLKNVRRYNIAHYMSFLFIGTLSFIILIVTFSLATEYPSLSRVIFSIGVPSAFCLVLFAVWCRDSITYLNRYVLFYVKIAYSFRNRLSKDFLLQHFLVSIAVAWIPLVMVSVFLLISSDNWISTSSEEFQSCEELLFKLITIAGAVLGVQLTLFTFVTGNLVSRYSSAIAASLVRHKAIISVLCLSLTFILSFIFALIFGYPDSFCVWPAVVGSLMFISLLLSVWIMISSISYEKAILYSGVYCSRKINRIIKRPLTTLGESYGNLWKLLAFLGLDWRNPEWLFSLSPPTLALNKVKNCFEGIFNSANKSIQDGQQEVFRSALTAVYTVATTYSKRKRLYTMSSDLVFTYINDQMSALIKSTSKSSNESLIRDAVYFTGSLACLTFELEKKPNVEMEGYPSLNFHNSQASHWINVLNESFSLSHMLMRSTAASEAIAQVRKVSLHASATGDSDTIAYGVIPLLKQMHSVSLNQPDSYHISLAGQCIESLIDIWWSTLKSGSPNLNQFQINSEIRKSLYEMAMLDFRTEKEFSLQFMDVASVISLRTSARRIIFADIFMEIAVVNVNSEDRKKRIEKSDGLEGLIELLQMISSDAIESGSQDVLKLLHSFYEIGYLTLFLVSEIDEEIGVYIQTIAYGNWEELVSALFESKTVLVHEWEHPMFSLFGLGVYRYTKTKNQELRERLISCCEIYLRLMKDALTGKKVVSRNSWSYLQLIGCWCDRYLDDIAVSSAIIIFISQNNPSNGSTGSRGYFYSCGNEMYGYRTAAGNF